jgi:hypothetical protein
MVITMTSGPTSGPTARPVVGARANDLADWWVDREIVRREFAAIVAANWPVQDQPAPRRRPPRVATLARPRQPDNQARRGPDPDEGEPHPRPVVHTPASVRSRQRSPPTPDPL